MDRTGKRPGGLEGSGIKINRRVTHPHRIPPDMSASIYNHATDADSAAGPMTCFDSAVDESW
jgi:hypothetical protein